MDRESVDAWVSGVDELLDNGADDTRVGPDAMRWSPEPPGEAKYAGARPDGLYTSGEVFVFMPQSFAFRPAWAETIVTVDGRQVRIATTPEEVDRHSMLYGEVFIHVGPA